MWKVHVLRFGEMRDVFNANELSREGWLLGEICDWGEKGLLLVLFRKHGDTEGDEWKDSLDEEGETE